MRLRYGIAAAIVIAGLALSACAPRMRCKVNYPCKYGECIETCESKQCRNIDTGRFVRCP